MERFGGSGRFFWHLKIRAASVAGYKQFKSQNFEISVILCPSPSDRDQRGILLQAWPSQVLVLPVLSRCFGIPAVPHSHRRRGYGTVGCLVRGILERMFYENRIDWACPNRRRGLMRYDMIVHFGDSRFFVCGCI